jgi:hypothetical protein
LKLAASNGSIAALNNLAMLDREEPIGTNFVPMRPALLDMSAR